MKKNYLTFLSLLLTFGAVAQQEQMYTQFFFNKLIYNPAYAGSFVSPTLTAVHRSQWIGLDGAPNAQALTYHQSMVNERVGIGGSLFRQQIGISTTLTLDAAYAYLKAATDDEPLDAVAARFGFNHPGRFTAQFRARFGINPGGARRRPRTCPGA